jgi:hypothetical protein
MNTETTSNQAFLDRLSKPITRRWPTFPNEEINLYIAVYKDGSETVVAKDCNRDSDQMTGLGFTNIGGEWMLPEVKLAPRDLMKVFPEMQMGEPLAADIFLDRTSLERPDLPAPLLKTPSAPRQAFADRLSEAVTLRWPNFPNQDISLSIAVYKDNSETVVAKGGEKYSEQLANLGFKQVGGEWMLPEVMFAPRTVMRLFPGMEMKQQLASDIFLDRTLTDRPSFPTQRAQDQNSSIGSKLKSRLAAAADAKQGQSQAPKF